MMKREGILILLFVAVLVLDLALAETDTEGEDTRPGRRNRNRNRNPNQNGKGGAGGRRGGGGGKAKSRGCKYDKPQVKGKEQCQSPDMVTLNIPLNATARNSETCAPTKEMTFNCSKLCKYDNAGTRPKCDTETRLKSITMTLKSDVSPSWCPATFVKTRPCGGGRGGGGGGRGAGRGGRGGKKNQNQNQGEE